MEEERGIRYFPIGLFASVMGFSGLSIAMKQVESLYHWDHIVSTVILIITSLLFIFYISVFLYRLIQYWDDVIQDFNHPIKMNFFAAISISLLLLAASFLEISNMLSFFLWIIGALLQITLTFVILSRLIWIYAFKIEQFNPTWFIPIVGNIVVPIAGSAHVPEDINWLFFSVGLFFSIVYYAIFFVRAFFYDQIPVKLLPSFFILMAPPAVGFISYLKMTGNFDSFSYILFGTAFFIGLLLFFQLKRFFAIPFFVTWWAFLFPSAAMTIATGQVFMHTNKVFYEWLFILQVLGLFVLAVYLSWRTIELIFKRKLCVKE